MVDVILFPSSFFSTKKVDEDLQREYDAVSATGLYDTIFFGYGKWFNEDKLVLSGTPTTTRKAIMRGWMMKPSQYILLNAFTCHETRLHNADWFNRMITLGSIQRYAV